jgi:tetratricopeptide (TPR) repeat protein
LQLSQVALARLTRGVARTMLGNKVASAGDYLEALKHYDSVIDPCNPDAIAVYRRAVAEHGLGQTAQALADYSTAIRLDPRNHLAYFGRGTLIASRERNYLRAIDDFNRGFVFLKLGEPAKAIKEYAAALEIDPNRQLALYGRALAYCHLGNTQECDRDKAAATAIAPDVAQQFARFGVS